MVGPEDRIEIIPRDKVSAHDLVVYSSKLLRKAFEDFGLGRDMAIGTAIALATLALQVWQHLIPLADWQEHKLWWVLSFVVPYVAVLGGHAIWRVLTAPLRLDKIAQGQIKQVNEQALAISARQRRQENREGTILMISRFISDGQSILRINPDDTATHQEIEEWTANLRKWKEEVSNYLWAVANTKFNDIDDAEAEDFYGAHQSLWPALGILKTRIRNLKEIMEKPDIYLAGML